MSGVKKSIVALRIYGDDLVPEEITKLLGVSPTYAQTKGQKIIGRTEAHVRLAKAGMWNLAAADREPEDIDGQIREIFEKMSANVEIWRAITGKYRANLFCGVFMRETNDGMSISPHSLAFLAARSIELWLDIYAPSSDAAG